MFGEFGSILNLFLNLVAIFGGGIGAFFIIKGRVNEQMRKSLENTIKTYKDELEATNKKLDRLSEEFDLLKKQHTMVISERDTYKQLIISALTSSGKLSKDIVKMVKDTSVQS